MVLMYILKKISFVAISKFNPAFIMKTSFRCEWSNYEGDELATNEINFSMVHGLPQSIYKMVVS